MESRARTPVLRCVALALASLSVAGCLKTRTGMKGENDNPDSGYPVKVVDAPVNENQRVVDELRGEINQLNGRIDELQKKNDVLAQDQSKKAERDHQMRELESKVQELQASQAAMIEALQAKQREREREKEKEKEQLKADPATVLEKARAAAKAKDHPAAIELYSQILKMPKSKATEDAYFGRAESYYAREQYKKAILDYSAIQEKYPKSKRVPKALLKTGMAFDALGMKADGKAFYQEILEKHAKAPEAKAAKAKLK